MANRVQRRIVFQRPDSREGRRTMRKKERKRERVTTTNPVGIKSLEKSRCMKETWKDFYCLGSVSSEENWGGGVARERGCDESGGGSFFFFFFFQIKTWLWFGPFIRIRTVRLIIAANRSRIFINDTSCCFQRMQLDINDIFHPSFDRWKYFKRKNKFSSYCMHNHIERVNSR